MGDRADLSYPLSNTHTIGGRSPVAFLVAYPVGWHGSFKWHIVASEAMLIGRKLPPDQTRSLLHTQSSCQFENTAHLRHKR